MRRKIGLMCLVALAACSSEGEPAGGPADPTSLSEPIATGIAILMIPTVPQLGAALQGVYQRIQTQVTSIGTTP